MLFPEASRKGSQGEPEGKLEGVFPVACFPIQNWRERPEDSSQHLPEKIPGCPEGNRKGFRKGKAKKSSLAAKGAVTLISKMARTKGVPGHFLQDKVRKTDASIKNTESRKVPGRKSRGFRKGIFMKDVQ